MPDQEFETVTYSAGDYEGFIQEAVSRLPHKYDMSLNYTDMSMLLEVLAESTREDAGMFLSDILTTLGIETI